MAMTISTDVTVDQAAYNLATAYALRPELYFDRFATVRPDKQAHPGKTVIFNLTADIAAATVALDESTDVTPSSMSDSQVTVTLLEQGFAVKTTAYLRGTSYVVPYDAVVANVVGFNAGISLDTLARIQMQAGSNVRYATGGATDPSGRTSVEPGDVLVSDDVRRALAELRGANVKPFGSMYAGMMHPDVAYDFRGATGGANWRDPHTYSSADAIWAGEIGAFEGVRYIESPRAPVFADAGSSTTLTDVYATLIWGQEALAKAHSYTDGNGAMPQIIPGPVTDTLRRFVPLGWYWLGGYKVYREAALRRIESSSSIGTNA
jgi:N4-gp56 family major capsid protein